MHLKWQDGQTETTNLLFRTIKNDNNNKRSSFRYQNPIHCFFFSLYFLQVNFSANFFQKVCSLDSS